MRRLLFATLLVVCLAAGGVATTDIVSVDGDSTPLAAELAAGTDPFAADTDGDGLDDTRERAGPTDPTDADTDGDGLSDGTELAEHGSDPTEADTDGDGLDDRTEVTGATDVVVADTDGDGLDDGREISAAGTDPTVADTDGDGLSDGTEVTDYGTDPTEADTDGDGLPDAREAEAYASDPTEADTDGDGLGDARELDLGSSPAEADSDGDGLGDHAEVTEYATDPTEVDTDDDHLGDAAEVTEYDTDATLTDTDGDGLPDGDEMHNDALADADPLRMDVFVEVDYMRGHEPPEAAIEMVEDAYANAPVENPDGTTGVDLHVEWGGAVPEAPTTNVSQRDRLMADHFDHDGDGYRYALAVNDVRQNGTDYAGFSAISHGNGQFIFQTAYDDGRSYPTDGVADLFMHELGHSVGLGSHLYEGIDSESVPYHTYRSTMNYDAPWGTVRYSHGDPFDAWAYIANETFAPEVVGEYDDS